MNKPLVSVVISIYNGKDHLGEAIQSVLDQTYDNLEIIVVDDVSPEDMSVVVNAFTDTRVKYLRHDKNRGAVAARKTGVHASSGEIIAFLDQDDLFHKEKLETHVNFLASNPEIGLSYNGRFEVLGNDKAICGIYKPPVNLTLADWVLGFPVSPSDTVLKRKWALMDEIWDDSFATQADHVIFNGQEIVFGGRLALAGCKFGNVGRALNYRRYHPHRVLKHLPERCQAELACQEIIFSDPRCPEDVRAIKNLAHSNIYVVWAYTAYIQEEFDLGRKFLKRAMELHPEFFMDGDPCQFLNSWLFWVSAGTVDYVRNHEEILRSIFENLPMELQFLLEKYDWTIAQSYLIKGLHTMVWGKKQDAGPYLKTAFEKNATADENVLGMLTDELLSYEAELGSEVAKEIVDQLSALLSKSNKTAKPDFLIGFYALNRAFRNYQAGRFESVPRDIARAVQTDFKYLWNRGVISILLRSLYSRVKVWSVLEY